MHWVQSGLVFECDDVEGARDEGEVVTYRNRVKDRVWFTTAIEQSGVKADDVVEAAAKLANSSPLPESEPMKFERVRENRSHKAGEQPDSCPACAPLQEDGSHGGTVDLSSH